MAILFDNTSRTNAISGRALSVTSEEARDTYTRAWQLGIVAGLRSMMPLALLAWTHESADASEKSTRPLRYVTGLAALAEVVADKLPIVPDRLRPGSLTGRLLIGALAGGLFSRRNQQQPALPGAINGALGAGLGSLAGFTARTILSGLTPLPDALWASLEDSLALRLGLSALRKKR